MSDTIKDSFNLSQGYLKKVVGDILFKKRGCWTELKSGCVKVYAMQYCLLGIKSSLSCSWAMVSGIDSESQLSSSLSFVSDRLDMFQGGSGVSNTFTKYYGIIIGNRLYVFKNFNFIGMLGVGL
jgi:hypothetical protein